MAHTEAPVHASAAGQQAVNTPPLPPPGVQGWGQVTGGAAAIAYPAMLKLMDVLVELMALSGEQACSQVETQVASAKANSQLTYDAACDQANATTCQAVTSFASAATSTVTTITSGLATKSDFLAARDAGARSGQLDILHTNLQQRLTGGQPGRVVAPAAGAGAAAPAAGAGAAAPAAGAGAAAPAAGGNGGIAAGPTVTARQNELRNGVFSHLSDTDAATNEAAIRQMDDAQVAEFSKALSNERLKAEQAVNSIQSKLQSAQTTMNLYKEIASGAINGMIQGCETIPQREQGSDQGNAGLANTNTQIAGGMLSNSTQMLGKWYDEALQTLAMLQQLAATTRVQ